MKNITALKNLALTIVFLLSTLMFNTIVASACPSYPEDPITWDGRIPIITTYQGPNGCTIVVTTYWCYGRSTYGFHHIALDDIQIRSDCPPGSFNPDDYYSKEVIDEALIKLSRMPKIYNDFLGLDGIPDCPDIICYLQVHDAKCYRGWLPDGEGGWKMDVCQDDELRKCHSVIHICYDREKEKMVVKRTNFVPPAPCPSPECNYKCFTD